MKEECLICGAPLKYLDSEQEAQCVVCKKTEKTRTICVNGHYVCGACHTKGIDGTFAVCLNEKSKKPVKQTETVVEETDQPVDEGSDIAEFKHVRDEMERLGFETLDEYFDYLDYIEQHQKRKSSSMQM